MKRCCIFSSCAAAAGALLLAGVSLPAQAGECVLNIERTACPGKETESYSKCGGKKSCNESKKTASAESCAKEAVKACQNKRYDQTHDKKVTAQFDGKAVESGKDFCVTAVSGIFDPAKDFPFRGKKECK